MADKWDSVMTIVGLAEYLKLPKSTPCELAQEGRAPGQKVRRHWRFHRAVVDQWLGKTNDDTPPPSKRRGSR